MFNSRASANNRRKPVFHVAAIDQLLLRPVVLGKPAQQYVPNSNIFKKDFQIIATN
ncbi:hypothetical protein JYQ62_01065 [Nostoc sp. UHCC 0702]|nr:hypothetical protein JYQ62_01065 [Nostoc sp. UHCC 0702]